MNTNKKQFILFLLLNFITKTIGFTSLPSTPLTTSSSTSQFTKKVNELKEPASTTQLSVSIFSDVLVPATLLYAGWFLFIGVATDKKADVKKPRRLNRSKATFIPLPSSTTATIEPVVQEAVEKEQETIDTNSTFYFASEVDDMYLEDVAVATTNLPVAKEVVAVVEEAMVNEEELVKEDILSKESMIEEKPLDISITLNQEAPPNEEITTDEGAVVKDTSILEEPLVEKKMVILKETAMEDVTIVREPSLEEKVIALEKAAMKDITIVEEKVAVLDEAASNVVKTDSKIKFLEGGKKRKLIKSFFTKFNRKVEGSVDDISGDAMNDVKYQNNMKEGKQSSIFVEEDSSTNVERILLLDITTEDKEMSTTKDKVNIQTFSQQSSDKQTTTLSRLLGKGNNIKSNSKEISSSKEAKSTLKELATEENSTYPSSEKEVTPDETVQTAVKAKKEEFVPKKMNWKREIPFVIVYTKDNPIKLDSNKQIISTSTAIQSKSSSPKSKTMNPKNLQEKEEKPTLTAIQSKPSSAKSKSMNPKNAQAKEAKLEKSKAVVITSQSTRKRDKFKNLMKQLNRNSKRVTTVVSLLFCLFLSSSHSSSNVVTNGKQSIAMFDALKNSSPTLDKSNSNTFATVTVKHIELSPLHKNRIMELQQKDKERRSVYVASTTGQRKEEMDDILKVQSNDADGTFIPVAGQLPTFMIKDKYSDITVTHA